jgi:REP element-mobilizing transposase RayT
MSKPTVLHYGGYYHIFNRGNNRERIFREPRNYNYFLKLYEKYIPLVVDTFAFCLLSNHFHLLVRVKTAEEQVNSGSIHLPV